MSKVLKILFVTLAAFFTFAGSVQAQEVTVTGIGIDKNEAVRNASRLAVEQVAGVYIDSKTLMKDLIIQLDEVYKKSQGFIKKIQILNEEKLSDSTYRVKAKIEVDTSPDSKLIDELTMIMQLNDPRIIVLVFDGKKNSSTRYETAEEFLQEKLLDLGFSHILESEFVVRLNNSELLKNIEENKRGFFKGRKDNVADYLVIGKIENITSNVAIPNYSGHGMQSTNLQSTKTSMNVEIIKYDTGEIVGNFIADGAAVENTSELSKAASIRNVSGIAAEKLAETFKKFSAKTAQGITFTITAANESKLQQIINELRELGMVDGVYFREQKKNCVVLSVESSQKPYTIVNALKSRTKLGVFVENVTNSTCTLKVN